MRITTICSVLTGLLLFCSCKKEIKPVDEIQHTIVVQGYLYAGMPVENISIQKMDIGGTSQAMAIENISAFIKWNNTEYALENMPGKSGYYQVNDSSLQIISGETYSIQIDYNGKLVSASTTVPPPVTSCITDISTVVIGEGNTDYNAIHVAWQTPVNFKTTLSILNMSDLQNTPIDTTEIDCNSYESISPFNSLLSTEVLTIWPCDFTHLGIHQLMLATINPEAEYLFQQENTIGVGSDGGNINNGSGIFTSFNGYVFTVGVQ